MSDFKNSKTYKNLFAAYSGECQATNKYLYYAAEARKMGLNQISDIFIETEDNERAHAKIWFKLYTMMTFQILKQTCRML